MKLVKATEADSEEIKGFFSRQVFKGVIDYKIERTDSFFLQYKLVTDNYSTYLLRDENHEIVAMASILFRKGYIKHQEQSVGFVADLCVSPELTPDWGEYFLPALNEEMEKNNCQYVFSSLEQYDNELYNSLLRRPNKNNQMNRYHLFRKFFLVFIFGRKFWRDEPLRSINIDYGRTEDIEPICHYLREKAVRKPLFFNLTPEELERRLRVWPHFSMQNFIIARNSRGEITGCMAPWNNKHVQQYKLHKYHGKSFQVYSTVQTLSPLGLLRPFPKDREAFNLKFLTHWACDNPDIFYSLLDRAYSDTQNKELIVYPNYIGDYASRPPRAYFSVKIPYGFYTLLDGSKKLPSFLHPNPFIPPPDYPFVHF